MCVRLDAQTVDSVLILSENFPSHTTPLPLRDQENMLRTAFKEGSWHKHNGTLE